MTDRTTDVHAAREALAIAMSIVENRAMAHIGLGDSRPEAGPQTLRDAEAILAWLERDGWTLIRAEERERGGRGAADTGHGSDVAAEVGDGTGSRVRGHLRRLCGGHRRRVRPPIGRPMKLLVCTECRDTIALTTHEERRCRCGAVAGQYREDGHHADASGPYLAFGMHSEDILRAVYSVRRGLSPVRDVRAWVIPAETTTIHRYAHLSTDREDL